MVLIGSSNPLSAIDGWCNGKCSSYELPHLTYHVGERFSQNLRAVFCVGTIILVLSSHKPSSPFLSDRKAPIRILLETSPQRVRKYPRLFTRQIETASSELNTIGSPLGTYYPNSHSGFESHATTILNTKISTVIISSVSFVLRQAYDALCIHGVRVVASHNTLACPFVLGSS